MTINTYDENLSTIFRKSDEKPDKQFSFLPTIMNIVGNPSGKEVLDLGCGDGFFTIALAKSGAKHVIGIDNSVEQIRLANEKQHPDNISYVLSDIFKDKLPSTDIVLSPFVVNYSQNTDELKFLFENIYQGLNVGGKVVFVLDLPKGKDLKKFGSIKTLKDNPVDGDEIKIDLYNDNQLICTLFSHYYKPETIKKTLSDLGFKNITWHNPIVSDEGIDKFGKDFWNNFIEDSELGYLSAEK